ncbi:MAG: hypothetical protein AAF433_19305 [Bacteroidota bacterium]
MQDLTIKQLQEENGGFIIEAIATVASVLTIVYLAGAAHGQADCEARCTNN